MPLLTEPTMDCYAHLRRIFTYAEPVTISQGEHERLLAIQAEVRELQTAVEGRDLEGVLIRGKALSTLFAIVDGETE